MAGKKVNFYLLALKNKSVGIICSISDFVNVVPVTSCLQPNSDIILSSNGLASSYYRALFPYRVTRPVIATSHLYYNQGVQCSIYLYMIITNNVYNIYRSLDTLTIIYHALKRL